MTEHDTDFLIWPWTPDEAFDYVLRRYAADRVAVAVKPHQRTPLCMITVISLDVALLTKAVECAIDAGALIRGVRACTCDGCLHVVVPLENALALARVLTGVESARSA